LDNVGDENIAKHLTALLDDSDPYVRSKAIEILGKHRNGATVGLIMKCLNDSDPYVRTKAIETLGAIGDKTTIQYLKPLLNDKDNVIKAAAKKAIDKLRNK